MARRRVLIGLLRGSSNSKIGCHREVSTISEAQAFDAAV
jgi:hypothetical protein